MGPFLRRLACYALVMLVLAIGLDMLLSYFLRQTKEYPGEFEVMNDIYEGKAACDVAIYGSSRAWNHIDPRIMKDSTGLDFYNFGLNGQNFWLQYLRHLEFRKHNPKPRTIIMSLDIFSFQPKSEMYNVMQFYPYMLWNMTIREYTMNYKGFAQADYFIPLLRYSGKRKALSHVIQNVKGIGRKEENFRYRGFTGLDKPWTDEFENVRDELGSYNVAIDTQVVNLFKRFIRECEADSVPVILLYSPEYIEGQRFVSNRDSLFNFFHQLSSSHGLLFLDYSQDTICHDRSLFFNASHLNRTGAEIFSRKLAGNLRSIFSRVEN